MTTPGVLLLAGSAVLSTATAYAASPNAPSSAASASAPASAAEAQPPQSPPQSVTVVGQTVSETATGPVDGYDANRSSTGLRLDVPLQDQPLSVMVIPSDVLSDLAVRNPTEVADYVAGVARETTEYSPNGQSFFIRGFSTYGAATTMDGYRMDGFLGVTDPSFIERVEFLKGPASVLAGASSAISGIVNTVTKRPSADPFTRVEASGGSFGDARLSLDANRPLSADDSLLGRINIAAERSDGFRSYPGSTPNESLAITPTLRARLSPSTTVEVEISAIGTRYGGRCMGIGAEADLLTIPYTKEVICDDMAHATLNSLWGRADVEQRLNDQWSLRVGGFWSRSTSKRTEQYADNFPAVGADGRTIDRYSQFVDTWSTNATGRVEAVGKLFMGTVQHRLIVGADTMGTGGYYAFYAAPATPMDIIDTRYDGHLTGPFEPEFPPSGARTRSLAFYAQDYIDLSPQWKLLLGVRHDRQRDQSLSGDRTSVLASQVQGATSPRAGVVFEPATGTSLYASWARSFSPNDGTDRNGNLFPAERGVQWEGGLKQSLLDDRLDFTASIFQITRQNVLTADPQDPANFSIATGEQRSRGLELELVGRLTSTWQVLAAYTLLDAKVTRDNVIPVGQHLVGAARNSGSVWNKVRLSAFALPDWSVGLGAAASSDRQVQLPNVPFTLGSYVRWDAGIFWASGPWSVQANVKNLTNRRIFEGQGYDLVPESPRAYYGTVAYTW